jgi:Histidine kinase
MHPVSAQPGRANLSNSTFYWRCQLGGWSAFLIFEFLLVLGLRGRQINVPLLAAYTCLVGLEGVLATHLLHLYLRSHGWLQLPTKMLALRFAVLVPSLAAVLAGLGWLTHDLLQHLPVRQGCPQPLGAVDPKDLFVRWLVQTFGLVVWTVLYIALHELQWRREAEGRALRLEMVAQEAQLRGLRAQLNPHFFFNCLNNLRELIAQNPERAQDMVTQLAGLLRYSLGSHQSELVPLSAEIQVVEDYLALEVARFEERLTVRWDVASEARSVHVPPMLLQTLVENALKHGIAPCPEGGAIEISARVDDRQMELQVLNTGDVHPASSGGIGLRNARERLKLLYGHRAKLVLQKISDGRVRASITLPLLPVEATS